MEGLNEMPINWELLLEKQSPDNAVLLLKNELGPSIIDIMEGILHHLQSRRLFALRSNVIRLVDYFSKYEASPCIEILIQIKDELLEFEGIDESTLKSMISGIQNLFLNMTYLLTYLQEALAIYPSEQEEYIINQKLKELNSQLLTIQKVEQNQSFSPKFWKDSLIF